MMKEKTRNICLIVMVIAAIAVISVFFWKSIGNNEKSPADVRNELLTQLETREGEYDEYSIILSNTSKSAAEALAQKIGAQLRITRNGSFATLTLTDGRTVRDIYENDEYLEDITSFSTDWNASISGFQGQEDDLRLPTAPTVDVVYALEAQPYLGYLNLSTVWNRTKGSGVKIAVIDTGIDTDHPEFAGRISEYSYNATEDKIVKDYLLADGSYDWSLIEDQQGHGTAVAGAVAASMNGAGMVGVAPEATIVVIKAECDENGTFKRTSDLVFGLYYAIECDVSVVNMSFGDYSERNPYAGAVQLAYDSDVICVAAAGNEGTASLCYPAADEHVIGVGALSDDAWTLASYSNYGENVDVVAPGTVYTTALGGGYKNSTGTSLAAPLVTGAIALLSSTDQYTTYEQVHKLLVASSYDLGDVGQDWYYGYGAVDVSALILEQRGTITYDMMTDELEDTTGLFIVGHTLQEVLEPERLYAVFGGWYYDPYYTEEYVWYEDTISTDITVYAKWEGEEDGIPYTYVELDDGTIEIRSYTGRRKYITVPEYIEGKLVTSIGDFAFSGERDLRSITLPAGLRHIGLYAFENCANLLNISIPQGVTEIEKGAFYNNIRLSVIAFEGTPAVKTIDAEAFAYCSKLTKIEIPASVTSIGTGAFLGTISMNSIDVQQGNEYFTSVDGVLFNATKSTLLAYPAARTEVYTIPENTRVVDGYAFAYSHMARVELSDIEKIGPGAFMNSYLTAVSIPNSVTNLADRVFMRCERLSEVTLGASISEIPGDAFRGCASLRKIAVPQGITSIGSYAFSGSSLSQITFAEESNLQMICTGAFAGTLLEKITLPQSLITIGDRAFAATYALDEVVFAGESSLRTIGAYAFEGTVSLKGVQLPDSLVQLGDFAFINSGLTGEVFIPEQVTYLGAGAFASCHSVESILVHGDNPTYNSINGVVYTEDGKKIVAYPAGNGATSYTVQSGTETVANAAFYGSENLTQVMLPERLVNIEEYAFAYVTKLQTISIPDRVMQIGRYAFVGDMEMRTVIFGENAALPRISFGAFAYSGIRSITIPKNVSTIAQGAFQGCSKLQSVVFARDSKLRSIAAYTFDGASNLQSITFLPGSELTSIQAHGFEGMAKLTTIDFGDANLTNIDNFAFRFCESLSAFDVPDGVTNIGRYAFYGCYGLTSVRIPASVEHIGSYAFLQTGDDVELYFAAERLPLYCDEDWDRGVKGYYLGVTDVMTMGDYQYAVLANGGVAVLKYLGTETVVDLSKLDLGSKIITIGGSAFAYSNVEQITLPETLVTIQRAAFYHSNLQSVHIPASVEFIGTEAFADTPITALTFGENSSLRVIEQSAFERTKKLTNEVVIPASVTTLGRAVFRNSGVTNVRFAEGATVTEIPAEMFYGAKITSFVLPNSVTKVCDGAFRATENLESFAYGDNLTWLGANAFYQSGLRSFHISSNLTVIEEFALVSLEKLTTFTVDEANTCYKAVDGLLLSKDGTKLIAVPAGRAGTLTVPVGVEKIGYGALEASALDAVNFADNANILSIGYRAFFGAEGLTEMRIPQSVVAVDYYAFAYCKNLQKVTFAEGAELKGVYEGAFYGCNSLSDIVLPDGTIEISDFAFYGCTKLTKLPLSDTAQLKGIYSYAFAYTGITELTVPDSVIDIDDYAFMGAKLNKVTIPATNAQELLLGIGIFEECNEMTEITLPFIGASYEDSEISWFGYIFGAGAPEANATYVPESLKKVNINGSITFVGYRAFDNLKGLKEISVPASVNTIYNHAFYGTIARYELTGKIKLLDDYGNLRERIDGYPFGQGISGELHLANGVKEIVDFSDHKYLTGIVIPDGTTAICGRAFSNCSNLINVTIPDSVITIGGSAFSGCSSLTSINIPNSVTSIGGFAFSGCSNLTSITIPDSVTSIGSSAFSGCRSLKRVYITDIAAWCSTELANDLWMYGADLYLNGELITDVVIPEGVTAIRSYAFYGCSSLQSITIPDSVTSIGGSTFKGCSSLRSITIPDSVTSVGWGAFYGCSSLQSITIPDGVTSIGGSTFKGGSSLRSITIPNGVTSIGNSAFSGCSSLTSITIPDSVTSIEQDAFYGCKSLYVIYNNSDIVLNIGSEDHGGLAYYAKLIVDKEGNKNYKTEETGATYFETADGFLFMYQNGIYKLSAYLGDADTVTLPMDINDNAYEIYCMRGVKNVIIPDGVTSIGNSAFEGCSSLQSITIPDSVTSVGWGAFSGCSSLQSVTIPDSVSSIGDYAFSGCSSLQSVTIPDSVSSIGDYAFRYCSSLRSVTIPDSVTSIGDGAFYDCSKLTDIIIGKGVSSIGGGSFSGCTCRIVISEENPYFTVIDGVIYNKAVTRVIYVSNTLTEVTIPKTINNISHAFRNNTGIEKVCFEEGTALTSIGSFAFDGCNSLQSITIPDGVTSIDYTAFSGCSSLTSITIPDSVTSIGQHAFKGCSSLTNVTIPDGVTSIGWSAFEGCSSLTSITIPDGVTSIESSTFKGCSSLTNVTIPDSVTSIEVYAFRSCSSLRGIAIPDGVTSIGESTFEGCSSLTNVTIPDSVTSIGYGAFSGCSSLRSITIPDSVTSIGNSAFEGCSSLTNVTIPDGVTSIGYDAFSGCSSLTSITIPDGVTSIESRTFKGCSSLTNVTIPDGVTSIGWSAFEGCSSLTKVYITDAAAWCSIKFESRDSNPLNNGAALYLNGILVTDVTDLNGISLIDDYAFSGCNSLMSITIPESVASIGSSAFYGCSSLQSITIPDSVTSVGWGAFYGCSSLQSITIPDSVTSIGDYAFYGCSSLQSVTIPDSVSSIGYDAFSGCSSLTSITIPDGVTSIESRTFKGCSSLTNVTIPDGVTSIGGEAFYDCSSLMSITIPDGVTSIGNSAFSRCNSLYVIYNNSDIVLNIGSEDHGGLAYYAKLIVDKEGNKNYKTEETGATYFETADGFLFMYQNGIYKLIAYLGDADTVTLPMDINDNAYEIYCMRGVKNVIIPDGVTSIGNSAFEGCSSLQSITIPDSVTAIGDNAFRSCSSLTSVTIPDGVTAIGSDAFRSCSSLSSVSIPASVTSIGWRAFEYCSSLMSITIPNGVTYIGNYAFNGCRSLVNITIPESVTSIGQDAFWNNAYYADESNWNDGSLYIGKWLIRADTSAESFEIRPGTIGVASCAFSGCYSLKHLTIGGGNYGALSELTNLVTLKITKMPASISDYFRQSVPMTLKNIVLSEGVQMSSDAFSGISGVTIYVEDQERDVRWDDNYPGWNNGNTVIYGDRWIEVSFYDGDGKLFNSEIFSSSQVIRIPYLEIADDEQYTYILEGWDLDGDGVIDPFPATSTRDIESHAVVKAVLRQYMVTFLDKDGQTPLYTMQLPYGAAITLPDAPTKVGYTFQGWEGYTDGMTVTGEMTFQSRWSHDGGNHVYGEPVWVDPTCTERGYNKHTCTICGEWYGTDHVAALGHSYSETVVKPDCTNSGYTNHVCGNCAHEFRDAYVDALGHRYGEMITDTSASCTTAGQGYRICGACSNEEPCMIPATGHSYMAQITKQPTCTTPGEITYTCTCGYTCVENVDTVEHSYEQRFVSKSFLRWLIEHILNVFFGYKGDRGYYFVCSECGHIATADEVTLLYNASASTKDVCEHSLGNMEVISEATYMTPEISGRTCVLCGKTVDVCQTGEVKPLENPGDLNGDEGVTQDDAIYLLKHTFRPNSYPIDQPVDYNGDGSVNQDDAIYLLKHTFRPNAYPLTNALSAGQ